MSYVVLDVDVFVAACWRHLQAGQPSRLLHLCLEGSYTAIYTQSIFEEYRAALASPAFGIPANLAESLLASFASKAFLADPLFHSLARPQCKNAADQKYYDTACCCDALLITGHESRYPADKHVMSPAAFFG